MEHSFFYFDFIVIEDAAGTVSFFFLSFFNNSDRFLLSSQDLWWLVCDAEWTLEVAGHDGVWNGRLKNMYHTQSVGSV